MKSSRYKNKQLKFLAYRLKCKPTEIEYICANLRKYYGKRVENKINKKTGDPKSYQDGTIKARVLRPSHKRLKVIQKNIKEELLSSIQFPSNIQGGVKGKSNITNGKVHQGNKYKFTTDLQDYFPSISYKKIYSMYLSHNFSNHAAHWLTKLTSKDFELPQGTPTSTHIANIIFLPTDHELIKFCEKHNITYTRFVDDLTFSSSQDFKAHLNTLLSIIIKGGFKIGYRKTEYQGKPLITGIFANNNFIDVPDNIKEKAKSELSTSPNSLPYNIYMQRVRSTNKNIKC